jgi:hypothetical protein
MTYRGCRVTYMSIVANKSGREKESGANFRQSPKRSWFAVGGLRTRNQRSVVVREALGIPSRDTASPAA